MSEYQNNSIFWVEASKIQPNPYQPRKEFEPRALEDLADSIRQYGVLQPLVVTRKEILRPDNHGMDVHYELIAGERRLRASKIAGLAQVPIIIRKETDNKVKLELAIIENLQREDLNPLDRAVAFEQLYKEFELTHAEIGKKMGKSRVYVSNTLRLLSLPDEIKQGLLQSRITEGHTRPLLMLTDRPEEQTTLFKEIMVKKMSVRDAEKVARKIAQDKVRKKEFIVDPKILSYEKQLAENLGTRVHIEAKENGGQITIDYFTIKDLEQILSSMQKVEREQSMMENYLTGEGFSKQEIDIEKSTGISMNSSHVDPEVDKKETSLDLRHKGLPEYTKKPHTEIEKYHQEITASASASASKIEIKDEIKDHVHDYSTEPLYSAPEQGIETIEHAPEVVIENPSSEIKIPQVLVASTSLDSENSQYREKEIHSSVNQHQFPLEQTPQAPRWPEETPIQSDQAQQQYQQPDVNQSYATQQEYQQPRKKGFFGRLFG
jgi:ParB family chromosome partitioning protein